MITNLEDLNIGNDEYTGTLPCWFCKTEHVVDINRGECKNVMCGDSNGNDFGKHAICDPCHAVGRQKNPVKPFVIS